MIEQVSATDRGYKYIDCPECGERVGIDAERHPAVEESMRLLPNITRSPEDLDEFLRALVEVLRYAGWCSEWSIRLSSLARGLHYKERA